MTDQTREGLPIPGQDPDDDDQEEEDDEED